MAIVFTTKTPGDFAFVSSWWVIGCRIVDRHLRSISSKSGLSSRTAARFAVTYQLV
jgi:hypothetical protein